MAKIIAMPRTRTAVVDLCMFGLAACDERGPGFVNVSVRTITNATRVGVRLQSKCASMRRHARVDCDNPTEKGEQTGSWVRQVAQAMEEQLKEDQQELETREKQRKMVDVGEDTQDCSGKQQEQRLESRSKKWENSCITVSKSCSVCGKDGTGMTAKVVA